MISLYLNTKGSLAKKSANFFADRKTFLITASVNIWYSCYGKIS